MQFKKVIQQLSKPIQNSLGGIASHYKFAPEYRKEYLLNAPVTYINSRPAAVLILLFPDSSGNTRIILTKRAHYKGHHANQISFPGGKKALQDPSIQHTAIRETHEEIGVHIPIKNLIVTLTDLYIPPSNFLVTPFIGYVSYKPEFHTNYEVSKIITPTLEYIVSEAIIKIKPIQSSQGILVNTPYLLIENETVWGATAMILSELVDLFKNSKV